MRIEKFQKIDNINGNIYKLLDKNSAPCHLKGELYISQIKSGEIKAWRKHKFFDAIFIVVTGEVQMMCLNDEKKIILKENLSLESCNFVRVSANTWYGFRGISERTSSIMAVIDGVHSQVEVEKMSYEDYQIND